MIAVKKPAYALKEMKDMAIVSYRVFISEDVMLYSGFDRKLAQAKYEQLNKLLLPGGIKPKHEYKRVEVKNLNVSSFEEAMIMLPWPIQDLLLRQATGFPATMSDIEQAMEEFPDYFEHM